MNKKYSRENDRKKCEKPNEERRKINKTKHDKNGFVRYNKLFFPELKEIGIEMACPIKMKSTSIKFNSITILSHQWGHFRWLNNL